jgi:hypothetical protein
VNTQLVLDLELIDAEPQPGQPRRYGRLQFSHHPTGFKEELAAIDTDEHRINNEERPDESR